MAPQMSEEVNSEISLAVNDGVTVLSNGVKVVNSSPHPFVFDDGTVVPPCGITLNAQFIEREQGSLPLASHTGKRVTFVVTDKVPTEEGTAFLDAVPDGVLVLGSLIAAEAYCFPVVQPVPTPETAGRGTAPADRRVRSDRFTRFGHVSLFE
tara:strand:- start:3581 stop:4036 length:456 start_codon:yes stop_codon:yes gene_type:complete